MNALLETSSSVYSEIMFTIISLSQNLIKGGVRIRARGLENLSKINKRGGTIIRYSSVYDSTIVSGTTTLFVTVYGKS